MRPEYHTPVGIFGFLIWVGAAAVFFLTSMGWLTWLLLLIVLVVSGVGYTESTRRGIRHPYITLASLSLAILSIIALIGYYWIESI